MFLLLFNNEPKSQSSQVTKTYYPSSSTSPSSNSNIEHTVQNIPNYFKPANTTVSNSTFPFQDQQKHQSDQIRFRGFVLRGQAETSLQLPRIETRARNWSALLFLSTNYRILWQVFVRNFIRSWRSWRSLPRNSVGSTD